MAKNRIESNDNRLPLKEMNRGKEAFRPLRHKESKAPYSDLEYLLLLGEAICEGEEEWKLAHPHREYKHEGVAPEVQQFAQIIYKGYKDGISKRELAEYIADSIDLES